MVAIEMAIWTPRLLMRQDNIFTYAVKHVPLRVPPSHGSFYGIKNNDTLFINWVPYFLTIMKNYINVPLTIIAGSKYLQQILWFGKSKLKRKKYLLILQFILVALNDD